MAAIRKTKMYIFFKHVLIQEIFTEIIGMLDLEVKYSKYLKYISSGVFCMIVKPEKTISIA